MKIVLDTNVLVSALLSPSGIPAKILNLVFNGIITLVYDNSILAEYIEVLSREKFKIQKERTNLIIDFICKECEFCITNPQKVLFSDEADRKFYELFKTAEIDYLITGNKKHFPNENFIVTPRTFIEREYKPVNR